LYIVFPVKVVGIGKKLKATFKKYTPAMRKIKNIPKFERLPAP